jgi:hypothetical protein
MGTMLKPRDGFEIRLDGFRLSLGRAAVVLIAAGVAAILYAVAERL